VRAYARSPLLHDFSCTQWACPPRFQQADHALDHFTRPAAASQDAPLRFKCMAGLAECLLAQGQIAEGEALHRSAHEARQRVLGPYNPVTLHGAYCLAACLVCQPDEAKRNEGAQLHADTLTTRERVLGADHPHTRASRAALAKLQQRVGAVQ
jgi:hypothetical protein